MVFAPLPAPRRGRPPRRAPRRGRIVTISSVGGRIATFALSAYCSTKFAQEGFAEALDLEVRPFGLRSILVEPGMIKTTRWSTNRGTAARALDPGSPYYSLFVRHEALADAHVEAARTQPADVANAIHEALTARTPRLRYIVGRPAAAAVSLRRYLPERMFERLYFGTLLRRITHGAAGQDEQSASAKSRA